MLAPHLAQEQRAGPVELAITTLSSLAAFHGGFHHGLGPYPAGETLVFLPALFKILLWALGFELCTQTSK